MKFIESICLKEGEFRNLELHQRRVALTTLAHFGYAIHLDLKRTLIASGYSLRYPTGLHKVRLTYAEHIEKIEVEKYQQQLPSRFKFVELGHLDYRFKYADRLALKKLKNALAEDCEPIFVQNELVTDCSYANLCFGEPHAAESIADGGDIKLTKHFEYWVTPAAPLLTGVARFAALAAGQVLPAQIAKSDLISGKYQKVKLINAMNLFDETRAMHFNIS